MSRRIPIIVLLVCAAWLIKGAVPPQGGPFHIEAFGRLPVLHNGRVKPLDSVARNALLLVRGKQTLRLNGEQIPAIEWVLDVASSPDKADREPVFRLDNPDVKMLLGWTDLNKKYYSYEDFRPKLAVIAEQASQVQEVDAKLRSSYQKAIAQLNGRLTVYFRVKQAWLFPDEPGGSLRELLQTYQADVWAGLEAIRGHQDVGELSDEDKAALTKLDRYHQRLHFQDHAAYMAAVPPEQGENPQGWRTTGSVLSEAMGSGVVPSFVGHMSEALDAYHAKDPAAFNAAVDALAQQQQAAMPRTTRGAGYEVFFNRFQPFYQSLALYLVCFLLVFCSWLLWPAGLSRAGFWVLLLAFAVHTLGLVSRMALQGRPPVTNLYSSAVFVGWVAIVLGIVLEWFYRNRIGTMVSAVIGFTTLIIAHHLSLQGDTLEMMQAVLDSNFWLSTHVVTITMGYGATFLAGTLGIIYVFRAALSKSFSKEARGEMYRMVYGIVCFALFLSFVGTILGGIWADQSWGRFWGWDPKENGALLIVLWNVIILHALKLKLIQERGLMLMAVFGNVITSLSWFGVNMLGVGLHSYGFMDRALVWLLAFIASQLVVIAIGFAPPRDKKRSADF